MVLSAKGEFHRRGGAKPPRQNRVGWPGLVAISYKGRVDGGDRARYVALAQLNQDTKRIGEELRSTSYDDDQGSNKSRSYLDDNNVIGPGTSIVKGFLKGSGVRLDRMKRSMRPLRGS